jgi:hypothetical protein
MCVEAVLKALAILLGSRAAESPLLTCGRASERRQSTEAQDVYGIRVRLTRDGLTYGEKFVAFDEMDGTRPVSSNLWNPATNLLEVTVFRRHGPPLIVKNLPLPLADRLRKEIVGALRERHS